MTLRGNYLLGFTSTSTGFRIYSSGLGAGERARREHGRGNRHLPANRDYLAFNIVATFRLSDTCEIMFHIGSIVWSENKYHIALGRRDRSRLLANESISRDTCLPKSLNLAICARSRHLVYFYKSTISLHSWKMATDIFRELNRHSSFQHKI